MGAADVVPGVSGGTMAFILGIYTRLIDAIKSFDIRLVKLLSRLEIRQALVHVDAGFLLILFAGIFSALLFFTRVVPLPALLLSHPEAVYGLFFGLIVGSVIVLMLDLGGLRTTDFGALLGGIVLGLLVVTAVPANTPDDAWFIFMAGALAICAMVVPGISGSFVLLILGKYTLVIHALGHFQFAIIVPFAAGAALGLALFTRVLSWILHHYERAALVAISGILIASLWVVWPFQQRQYVQVRGKSRLVESSPLWPSMNADIVLPIALAVTGLLAVIAIRWMARRGAAASPVTTSQG